MAAGWEESAITDCTFTELQNKRNGKSFGNHSWHNAQDVRGNPFSNTHI